MKTAEEMVKENQAAENYKQVINKILQKIERKLKKTMKKGFTSYDFRINPDSELESDDI